MTFWDTMPWLAPPNKVPKDDHHTSRKNIPASRKKPCEHELYAHIKIFFS